MSDDRELLRAAGKAAGEIGPYWYDNPNYLDGVLSRWNPLTDDGDALRLAVTCGIALNPMLVDGMNRETQESTAGSVKRWDCFREKHKGDAFAATRRAITRAAAEIGKTL